LSGPPRRRYRVAHVITRLELGGAQENTLFCVRAHDRRRFDVGLVAGAGGLLDADARAIPDARIDLVPELVHPVAPLRDLAAVLRLRALFKARRIDLVHTHSSKAGVLGRLAALLAGVPVVVHTVHGWSFNDTQGGATRRAFVDVERLAAGWAERLITVSARDRERGLALGIGRPEQYALVRSGIDLEAFRTPRTAPEEVRRRLGLTPEQIVVGTLTCLKAQKAPLDFVRAAAAAHAREPRLRFILAGDGEQRPAVEALIAELGLGGVVQLLGWRRDVTDLLHAMDLFLLTSRFEGLPRAVLQALAAGRPVVATAVDGTPEVIQHRSTGLLVPPGAPAAAAAGLIELVRDPALRARCVEEGRRSLNRAFDIHRMVSDLEAIYLSLLEA
jgi:glycosyltransferase involved in cell wall biosynthesis